MRAFSVAAERVEEVREAARGWRTAGAIGENTLEEILRRFPEPRALPSAVWRVLTFFFVTLVVLGTLLAFGVGLRGSTGWKLLFSLFAIAALAATEVQEASHRLSMRGGAGATSFWSVVLALAALFLFLDQGLFHSSERGLTLWLASAAALWAAACWRWGSPVYAAFAAIAFFAFVGRLPQGRPLWIAVGSALALVSARFLDDKKLAPSHRRSMTVLCAASLIAVYGAVNLYSFDEGILEKLRPAFRGSPLVMPAGLRFLPILGTVLLPLLVLAWGLRSRRTFVLDVGVLLSALSLITLRHYVHLAPLWVLLTAGGAILLGIAVFTERRLRRAPGGEIAGFTAEPLYEDEKKKRSLELVPIVAGFGAREPASATEDGSRFEGGGGSFGGGGASGSF